jgi:hypothetical protein
VYQQTHSLANKNIFDDVLNEDDLGFDSRPFVASFSQEDDALPQWRSYCPQGNGVAIGFRVDCLKRSVLSEEDSDDDNLALGGSRKALGLTPRILFRRIDYLDASRVQSLDDDIKTAIAESLQNEEEDRISYEGGVTYVQPASLYFKVIIEGRASFKKHPSFFAEREYRLLVDGSFFQAHLFKFRTTRSTLVPFMSVKIPLREWRHPEKPFIRPVGEGRWDFIDREVIGPTTNKGLSLDAVSAFFVKNRMDVEVVSSTIPYRDW